MPFIRQKYQFLIILGVGSLLFFTLIIMSFQFQIYEVFPAYGFIGYSLVIFIVMFALSRALLPWHFVLVSISLILFGTVASLDVILSKNEMLQTLSEFDSELIKQLLVDKHALDDFVGVLLILLNVFTSAVAGNAMFYGLNRRNFIDRG